MATLIKADNLKEGDFFNRWLYSRLITRNKNVLSVELGPTGSGKSYRDLRKAELWYNFYFHKEFPTENICFGVLGVMLLLSSGKLKKGEVIIFEEAGANLGNLDFQNKIAKMFNYVLQSFRSMNIAIFFNLPYFSMLNKTARMLIHYSGESNGIDKETGINHSRPFFHQINQKSGKLYTKFPKLRFKGRKRKLKGFDYQMPSKYLTVAYESKKKQYLYETTREYVAKIKEMRAKETGCLVKTETQTEYLKLYNKFKGDVNKVAEITGTTVRNVYKHLRKARIREMNL